MVRLLTQEEQIDIHGNLIYKHQVSNDEPIKYLTQKPIDQHTTVQSIDDLLGNTSPINTAVQIDLAAYGEALMHAYSEYLELLAFEDMELADHQETFELYKQNLLMDNEFSRDFKCILQMYNLPPLIHIGVLDQFSYNQ